MVPHLPEPKTRKEILARLVFLNDALVTRAEWAVEIRLEIERMKEKLKSL